MAEKREEEMRCTYCGRDGILPLLVVYPMESMRGAYPRRLGDLESSVCFLLAHLQSTIASKVLEPTASLHMSRPSS